MFRIDPRRLILALASALWATAAAAQEAPALHVALAGPPHIVFAAPRDGCDGNDVPDAPARAFRAADGSVALFGLHYDNRALRGPSLDSLKLDCHVVYPSRGNPDPAAYDDRSWIAATYTRDGRTIEALVHHEYQANEHAGRCRFPAYMQCWFNTVLAVRSTNGGADFLRPTVVASAPFRQDVEQGRHRGFFNPSNIVSDGRFAYVLASTTGWAGQDSGVCLFRTADPGEPKSWRAYDGHGFTIRYGDPYLSSVRPAPCAPIQPFPAPVGSLVRTKSGFWLAVFQAKADANLFPVSGFYVATSRDLLAWSSARLILPGATLYDDPCGSGGQEIAYPSILDPASPSRNFDTAGDAPELYYAVLAVEGCSVTGRRSLVRRTLAITPAGPN